MSSLCPLWDDMLPLDAVSLKTKQARPLSAFALRQVVPIVALTSKGSEVRSSPGPQEGGLSQKRWMGVLGW